MEMFQYSTTTTTYLVQTVQAACVVFMLNVLKYRTTSKSNPTPHTHQAQSSAHHKTDISPITEATQRKTSKDKVDDHARHKPPSTGGAEGSGQPHPQGHEKKKPTTKAERRALQVDTVDHQHLDTTC